MYNDRFWVCIWRAASILSGISISCPLNQEIADGNVPLFCYNTYSTTWRIIVYFLKRETWAKKTLSISICFKFIYTIIEFYLKIIKIFLPFKWLYLCEKRFPFYMFHQICLLYIFCFTDSRFVKNKQFKTNAFL